MTQMPEVRLIGGTVEVTGLNEVETVQLLMTYDMIVNSRRVRAIIADDSLASDLAYTTPSLVSREYAAAHDLVVTDGGIFAKPKR